MKKLFQFISEMPKGLKAFTGNRKQETGNRKQETGLLQEVLIETEEASKQEFITALRPFIGYEQYRPLLPITNRKALEAAYMKGCTLFVPFQGTFLSHNNKAVARFNKATLQAAI